MSGTWYRDSLTCTGCNSLPRERALAYVLSRELPNFRNSKIHESSPVNRGISAKLGNLSGYTPFQYFPNNSSYIVDGVRNINLEEQKFEDEKFDLFIP